MKILNFENKKEKVIPVYFTLFILFLVYQTYLNIVNGYSKNSWQITEFLINYQGGFVRRGLLGEVLLQLYYKFNLSPYNVIILFCTFCYGLLVFIFTKEFIKKGYPVFILIFPFFLGGPIVSDFIVRKDVLLILIFLLTLHFFNKKTNVNILVANLFLITGIFIHESIAFFCFPIVTLLVFGKNQNENNSVLKSVFITICSITPSLFAFCLTIYFKGSLEISKAIWLSWKNIPFPYIGEEHVDVIPAAVDGISWTLKQGILYTKRYIFDVFDYGVYAPIAWIFAIVALYYVLINTDKFKMDFFKTKPAMVFNKQLFGSILIFQFVCISPLFILGCDYGRWIFIWVSTSFAIQLFVSENVISNILPKRIIKLSLKINLFFDEMLSESKAFVLLLASIIGVPGWSWAVSSYLATMPFYIFLFYFSKIVEHTRFLLDSFF